MIRLSVLGLTDKIKPDDLIVRDTGDAELVKFAFPEHVNKRASSILHHYNGIKIIVRTKSTNALEKHNIRFILPPNHVRAYVRNSHGPKGDVSTYPSDIKMTFGKYKGSKISEIHWTNHSYIEWLVWQGLIAKKGTLIKGELLKVAKDWVGKERVAEIQQAVKDGRNPLRNQYAEYDDHDDYYDMFYLPDEW